MTQIEFDAMVDDISVDACELGMQIEGAREIKKLKKLARKLYKLYDRMFELAEAKVEPEVARSAGVTDGEYFGDFVAKQLTSTGLGTPRWIILDWRSKIVQSPQGACDAIWETSDDGVLSLSTIKEYWSEVIYLAAFAHVTQA